MSILLPTIAFKHFYDSFEKAVQKKFLGNWNEEKFPITAQKAAQLFITCRT